MTQISTDLQRLLTALGYTHERGHRWTHPAAGVMTTSLTPSDWRVERNTIAELRRRHPDHPALARQVRSQSATERKRRRRKNRTSRMTLVRETETGVVELFTRPEKTACIDCGRRWLSDLDPRQRTCPACDGEVVFGQTEERWAA
jgi:hypothetical protein